MKRIYNSIAGILFFFAAFSTISADETDRHLKDSMARRHIPGLAVAVISDGKVVKSKGYGPSNIELKAPVRTDTVFELGSLTKQFTAAAVMLLVEEGKVRLDDPIAHYLEGVPESWRSVTVRRLLTHSSGLREYLTIPGMLEETSRPGITHEEIAKMFFERIGLEFEPGTAWAYSNTGYLLLGNIIEKVSGVGYFQFLESRIFRPLGMNDTGSSEPAAIVPRRASGYEWVEGRFRNRPALTENAYAAGSIVSTVEDLVKWDVALEDGRLLKHESLEVIWTPMRTRGGGLPAMSYGFGWEIGRYRGTRVIFHSGGTPGFSSVIHKYPEKRLTVVILANHADTVLDDLAVDVAGFYRSELSRKSAIRSKDDRKLTARMKNAVEGFIAGEPERSSITNELSQFFKTSIGPEVWGWIGSGGELKTFEIYEVEKVPEGTQLTCRTVIGSAERWLTFLLNDNGEIAQFRWW